MNRDELICAIDELVDGALEGAVERPAHELGLDPRCGTVYVGEDFIATASPGNLDYYGGFEYISDEYTLQLGGHKFYYSGSHRVAEALARLAEEE
ncbi:MAG: hypothetical protein AB7D01_03585 [Methanoculleus sp.]